MLNSSPQHFFWIIHRKDWRQFAEIQLARIFEKTSEIRGDRPSPTSLRLYVNTCLVFKNWKHQQDFLFSETVKCHIMSCVLQYILVKKKELFPLSFTEGDHSSESPLLNINHSFMSYTSSQQRLMLWTTTATKFKSLIDTFTENLNSWHLFDVSDIVVMHIKQTDLPACVRRCPARASLRRQA